MTDRKVPEACIERSPTRGLCGREIDNKKDHTFRDAQYAIAIYSTSSTLRVCPDCVVVYNASDDPNNQGTMATRGLVNDK